MKSTQPCSECGTPFACGCAAGTCWCDEYPAVLPPDFSKKCLCPSCLAKAIGRHIQGRLDVLSFEEALTLAKQKTPSNRLLEHIDYTVKGGNYVFTRWYLLKQGKCCGNGCRNCPYPAKS
jgi:hypothetical protein